MKKNAAILCVLLLLLAVALTACTDKPEQNPQSSNSLPVIPSGESRQPGETGADPVESTLSESVPTTTGAEGSVPTTTEEEETVPEEIVVTIGEDEQVVGN